MGDEEYGDEDTSILQTGAAPLAVLTSLGNQYTSKEAHDLARRAYDSLQVERTELGEEEDLLAQQMQQAAEEAKTELRAARERLLARKFDQSAKWLALAEGFGSPTRSGGFGETIANVARGQREVNEQRHDFRDKQEAASTVYGQNISAIDRAIAQSRLDTAKARRAANARLLQEAMRTIGREVRPGANSGSKGPPSPFGKIAMDEGLIPGTPEFHARVRELVAEDARNRAATAGTDAPAGGEEEALSQQDQAHRFGVPLSVIDPYRGMSTKQKNAAMTIDQRDTQKKLDDMAAARSEATEGIAKMNKFLDLNRKVDTGFFKGLAPALSSAGQEMDAITAEAARKMKQPGEGSVSDFDGKQFRLATVSRSKTFQANRSIATAYKIMRKNEIDRVNFMQDYAALNGHLRGADTAWREYLEANPIFDPSVPDKFKLNENRVRDYRQWFRQQMGDQEVIGPDITDEEAAAIAADDSQGFAEGGRVSAVRRLVEGTRVRVANKHLHGAGKKGRIHSTSDKSGFVVVRMDDGSHRSYHESDLKENQFYADGGVVTDADVYDDPTEMLPQEEEEDDTEHLREALYSALQGATMGTADEVRGLADPQGAAEDRAEYSEYAGEHPGERAAAFSAGLLPLALLAARGPGGLLQSVALGAGTGAALGASSNVDERPTGAFEGGVEGALVAPVAALGTKYIYNKAGQLVDKLTGQPLSAAEEKLVLDANRDGIDLAQVAADLRASDRLRVPQGVQDVGGRRTQALIERAATRGGPGSEQFLEKEHALQDKATSRVEDQINRGLVPSEYFSEAEKLKNALYTNAKPLYEAAYKKYPGIRSKELMELAETDDGQQAIREAIRLMRLDRVPIGRAGPGGMVQKPSLQFMDYVKRGLDQMIATEEKGGPTPYGHGLRAARNRLRDELDNIAPEYKAARAQYAGDLEVRDALRAGREEIARMQPEEVRRAINGMSYAEKDAFRSGVSQHLFEVLGKPTTDFNAAQRILGSDSMREKLKATFDDPKKWKIFEAALDKEAEMFARKKKMLARTEGKKTQALTKEESLLSGVLDGGAANVPGMGGISWTNRIYNWLRFPMPMSEETADEILRIIDRGDVKAFDATMQRLARGQKRLAVRGRRAGKAGTVAAILAAGLTQPTPPGDAAKMEEE